MEKIEDTESNSNKTISDSILIFLENSGKSYTLEEIAKKVRTNKNTTSGKLSLLKGKGLVKNAGVRGRWIFRE